MTLVWIGTLAVFGIVIVGTLFFGLCNWTNCQLSLVDIVFEFSIALFMAIIIVLKIEFDLKKFRLWKFCKTVFDDLNIITAAGSKTPVINKQDLLKLLEYMKKNDQLVLDASTFIIHREMRSQIERFEEALSLIDNDLSLRVFDQLGRYLKILISRYKPPFYIMKAAQWSRSL